MLRLTLLAVALLVSTASARNFVVECDDFYPEAESPEHTTAIAEVLQGPDGTIAGLKCRLALGDPTDVCTINDGACCTCNVARGFTPECKVTVTYTATETQGTCTNTYPECYYGDNCGSMWGAFVTQVEAPVVKRSKKIKKPRKPKRR